MDRWIGAIIGSILWASSAYAGTAYYWFPAAAFQNGTYGSFLAGTADIRTLTYGKSFGVFSGSAETYLTAAFEYPDTITPATPNAMQGTIVFRYTDPTDPAVNSTTCWAMGVVAAIDAYAQEVNVGQYASFGTATFLVQAGLTNSYRQRAIGISSFTPQSLTGPSTAANCSGTACNLKLARLIVKRLAPASCAGNTSVEAAMVGAYLSWTVP